MSIPTKEWFSKANWLTEYPRSKLGTRTLPRDSVLQVRSLTCVCKNEFSKDEVSLLLAWATPDRELSGLVTRDLEFSQAGESQAIGLDLQLDRLSSGEVNGQFRAN